MQTGLQHRMVFTGATAGVSNCQTLWELSEHMEALLERQRRQRTVPHESCLLARGERAEGTG